MVSLTWGTHVLLDLARPGWGAEGALLRAILFPEISWLRGPRAATSRVLQRSAAARLRGSPTTERMKHFGNGHVCRENTRNPQANLPLPGSLRSGRCIPESLIKQLPRLLGAENPPVPENHLR